MSAVEFEEDGILERNIRDSLSWPENSRNSFVVQNLIVLHACVGL